MTRRGTSIRAALLLLCLVLGACASTGQRVTGLAMVSGRFCEQSQQFDARQQDRLLRFSGVVRNELDASESEVALISRSGLDLSRLGITYSHSGVVLKDEESAGWEVRQLYYACNEGRPRLYDQGLTGFLFGTDRPTGARISIVLLPSEQALQLRQAATDKTQALNLLAATYSANAYPFSTQYQNCNQWVLEILAAAFGSLPDNGQLRENAQRWLVDNDYRPRPVVLDSYWLKTAAAFSPMIHLDDHPQALRSGLRFQISLPYTIEAFVRQRLPRARRIELCHDEDRIVIRNGWQALDEQCSAGPSDKIVRLN